MASSTLIGHSRLKILRIAVLQRKRSRRQTQYSRLPAILSLWQPYGQQGAGSLGVGSVKHRVSKVSRILKENVYSGMVAMQQGLN